jgi:hypothetical protein
MLLVRKRLRDPDNLAAEINPPTLERGLCALMDFISSMKIQFDR